ncbi:MAG: LacI family DNA-binding transcriptional regulator [Clostridia bacterium]|nr:LacI family DNA-binding transcriptional regulator [Clostridia bacterium]
MVTLKDIAKAAGVAVSTVSYSLNNDIRIPDETRRKVISIAEQMGYTGKSGRRKESGYFRQIVLCLNSIGGEIYPQIVSALKKVLNFGNCELLIYIGKDVSRLKWVDGLIILNSEVEDKEVERVAQRRIPIVFMDRDVEISDTASITLDNYKGLYKITEMLLDKGAKNFAFVNGPQGSYESQDRFSGFSDVLTDRHIAKKNIISLQSDFTYDGGVNASRYLLGLTSLPDAIVCANDEMAWGVIDGLHIGTETAHSVTVTGFDGIMTSGKKYITASADRTHWGSIVGYTMLQWLERIPPEQKHIKVPVEVVVRY